MFTDIIHGLRKCFFWTEKDTIELELVSSRIALLRAEQNAETAIHSIKMLEERIARLRKGEYGDQAKASIDIGQAQQQLDEFHINYEISMRDVRIMQDRIPRLAGHLRNATNSFQVNDKNKFFQPTIN